MGLGGMRPSKAQSPSHLVQHSLSEAVRARAWRVIHACENARDVLPVVEGQLAAGMRPYIVTPEGEGSAELYLAGRRQDERRPLSLLRSWQDVRNWRKSILDCDPANSADLVHAHSFAAGMAAVRSIGGVVYDLPACIEELAISAGQCETGSWMGRSFRVAEQFVLSRAAAVIIHSLTMKDAALERGAPSENIFLIPDPLTTEDDGGWGAFPLTSSDFLQRHFGLNEDSVTFLVPQFSTEIAAALTATQLAVLESFAQALREGPQFHLFLEGVASPLLREAIQNRALSLGVQSKLAFVEPADANGAWQSADIVIATGDLPSDPLLVKRPNQICLDAMRHGKALLAADRPRNRETSPDGRGCLWFEHNNPVDLALRLAFLGHNPEFRAALGATARSYILESRSTASIGQKYQDAYRHAFNRRKSTGPGAGMVSLQPATNWS